MCDSVPLVVRNCFAKHIFFKKVSCLKNVVSANVDIRLLWGLKALHGSYILGINLPMSLKKEPLNLTQCLMMLQVRGAGFRGHLTCSFSFWARSTLCIVFTSMPYSLPSMAVDGSAEVEKMRREIERSITNIYLHLLPPQLKSAHLPVQEHLLQVLRHISPVFTAPWLPLLAA